MILGALIIFRFSFITSLMKSWFLIWKQKLLFNISIFVKWFNQIQVMRRVSSKQTIASKTLPSITWLLLLYNFVLSEIAKSLYNVFNKPYKTYLHENVFVSERQIFYFYLLISSILEMIFFKNMQPIYFEDTF